MCTKFLLEAWKQQTTQVEAQKEKTWGDKTNTQKRKTKYKEISYKEKKTKWAYRKLHTYETLYKIIQNMNIANADILKRIFSLLDNPLVLFNKISQTFASNTDLAISFPHASYISTCA